MKHDNSIFYDSITPYEKEKIKVQYKKGSPSLEQNEKGGCIDLYNYEDTTLNKGDFALIDLGIAMQLPQGYDAIIIPRSSTFRRYGLMLVNSPGYIDNSYAGPDDWWFAPVLATKDIYIPKGTRCFQFRLVKIQPMLDIDPVSSLGGKNRSGNGSTGR